MHQTQGMRMYSFLRHVQNKFWIPLFFPLSCFVLFCFVFVKTPIQIRIKGTVIALCRKADSLLLLEITKCSTENSYTIFPASLSRDNVSAGVLCVALGATFLDRCRPTGMNPEVSCRKDQRAGNHDLPGRMTALGLLCLKERRLRLGEGRMIIFLKYAKDCC